MSGEAAYLLALTSIRGIGPIGAVSIAKRFRTPADLERVSVADLDDVLGERLAAPLRDKINNDWRQVLLRSQSRIDEHLELGIQAIAFTDDGYPALLRHIADPPPILYVKGSLDTIRVLNAVAIIGTRNPTVLGERVAGKIARYFATSGFVVISGLARGIDSAAQTAASESGLTVAVLANSLDKVYPAENRKLAERIIDAKGALVSELALGEQTFKNAFVRRDRIQSGMSLAVIPIQTDIEGGTMHTVRFAEDQKRLLFCPIPMQEESGKTQYAGIWHLIQSNRAKSFQSQDYPELLAIVQGHKLKLMVDYGLEEVTPLVPQANYASLEPATDKVEQSTVDKSLALRKLADTCRELGLDTNKEVFSEVITQLQKRLFGGAKRAKKKPAGGEFPEDQPKLIV